MKDLKDVRKIEPTRLYLDKDTSYVVRTADELVKYKKKGYALYFDMLKNLEGKSPETLKKERELAKKEEELKAAEEEKKRNESEENEKKYLIKGTAEEVKEYMAKVVRFTRDDLVTLFKELGIEDIDYKNILRSELLGKVKEFILVKKEE